jgi:phosphatidylserine/phosphatidylglycerophosphate/cardiolipin synthase-like enzyme
VILGTYGASKKKMLAPFFFLTCLFGKQDVLDSQDCIAFTKRTLKNNGIIDRRFFTPDDAYALQKIVVGLIDMEKSCIRALMFRLTNQPITDALVRAKKRGVNIDIVVDSGASSLSHYSKIHMLAANGVPLYVYQPMSVSGKNKGYQSLMHQKTIIFSNTFGGRVVTTGSLNYTYAAFHGNEEAVNIRNSTEVFKDHEKNFSRVQNRSFCYDMRQSKTVKSVIPSNFLRNISRVLNYAKK